MRDPSKGCRVKGAALATPRIQQLQPRHPRAPQLRLCQTSRTKTPNSCPPPPLRLIAWLHVAAPWLHLTPLTLSASLCFHIVHHRSWLAPRPPPGAHACRTRHQVWANQYPVPGVTRWVPFKSCSPRDSLRGGVGRIVHGCMGAWFSWWIDGTVVVGG